MGGLDSIWQDVKWRKMREKDFCGSRLRFSLNVRPSGGEFVLMRQKVKGSVSVRTGMKLYRFRLSSNPEYL